jgi:hypothetical protein
MSFRYRASSVFGFATAANSSKAFRPSRWAISANVAFSPSESSSRPLNLTSQDPVLCPKIFVPHQEFLVHHSSDVGHHARPKHLGFPLNLQHSDSEIVDAVFQSEKSIRGAPVESYKLRYFNSFEFFDHTRSKPSHGDEAR